MAKAPANRKALVRALALGAVLLLFPSVQAQPQEQPARFTGAWTGVQRWKVDSPSPYTREGQNVTLTIGTLNGKINGLMTPFLGSAEGATFADGRIVGNQLRANAMIGAPKSTRDPYDWKDSVEIAFVFTLEGNELAGTANLILNETPWLKLEYRLNRQ